jgi:hypothetical protein
MHDSAIATTCWFVEFGTRPVYASSSEVGIATLGSYEFNMSRTCWDYSDKKDAVMAGCAGRR